MSKAVIQIDGKAYEKAEELRVATNREQISEVVRDALALYAHCYKHHLKGRQVAITDKKGNPMVTIDLPFLTDQRNLS